MRGGRTARGGRPRPYRPSARSRSASVRSRVAIQGLSHRGSRTDHERTNYFSGRGVLMCMRTTFPVSEERICTRSQSWWISQRPRPLGCVDGRRGIAPPTDRGSARGRAPRRRCSPRGATAAARRRRPRGCSGVRGGLAHRQGQVRRCAPDPARPRTSSSLTHRRTSARLCSVRSTISTGPVGSVRLPAYGVTLRSYCAAGDRLAVLDQQGVAAAGPRPAPTRRGGCGRRGRSERSLAGRRRPG